MTMSEAFDLSNVQRELCVLKRNAFKEVAETTTRIKSDQEITRAEIDELQEKLELLIKDLNTKAGKYIETLDAEGEGEGGRKMKVKLKFGMRRLNF